MPVFQKIVDVISTGSTCPSDRLKKACDYLAQKGLSPRTSPSFFSDHPLYICHDHQRLLNLKEALYAEDSDIIWCLRGGFGTSRLLPKLLSLNPPKRKKTLIGFSDVTALHLFLTQYWGWQTIHGPTLNSLIEKNGQSDSVVASLDELIQQGKTSLELALVPLNRYAHQKMPQEGLLCGGNLTLIQHSLGTPWELETKGKILFFEDVNEAPYRIAEKLDHLKNVEIFKDLKAVVFGQFTRDKPEKNDALLLKHVLDDFAHNAPFPVFSNLAVGHISHNYPLQLNTPATLIMKENLFFLQQVLII